MFALEQVNPSGLLKLQQLLVCHIKIQRNTTFLHQLKMFVAFVQRQVFLFDWTVRHRCFTFLLRKVFCLKLTQIFWYWVLTAWAGLTAAQSGGKKKKSAPAGLLSVRPVLLHNSNIFWTVQGVPPKWFWPYWDWTLIEYFFSHWSESKSSFANEAKLFGSENLLVLWRVFLIFTFSFWKVKIYIVEDSKIYTSIWFLTECLGSLSSTISGTMISSKIRYNNQDKD